MAFRNRVPVSNLKVVWRGVNRRKLKIINFEHEL
jgi:hypothetical protein